MSHIPMAAHPSLPRAMELMDVAMDQMLDVEGHTFVHIPKMAREFGVDPELLVGAWRLLKPKYDDDKRWSL